MQSALLPRHGANRSTGWKPDQSWGVSSGLKAREDMPNSFEGTNMPDAHLIPRLTIAGVPMHAMLVPFPITCFTGALVTDIAYLNAA